MFSRRQFLKLSGAVAARAMMPGWLSGRAGGRVGGGPLDEQKPAASGWAVPMTVAADSGLKKTLRPRAWLPMMMNWLANRD